MPILDGVKVLLVEDDADVLAILADLLSYEGAVVATASDAADARRALERQTCDVLITDLALPDGNGFSLLRDLRAAGHRCAAIAMTAHSASWLSGNDEVARFEKVLRKPFDLNDLVIAVASLAGSAAPDDQLRSMLENANSGSPFRFTSFFRFDDAHLTSVWSFDRVNPTLDQFPLDVDVEDSYCAFVRDHQGPFVVEDAESDPRVARHPKRSVLRAYCGVPVRNVSGKVIGSLCHFDAEPRTVPSSLVAELTAQARRLEAGVLSHLQVRRGSNA